MAEHQNRSLENMPLDEGIKTEPSRRRDSLNLSHVPGDLNVGGALARRPAIVNVKSGRFAA